MSSKKQSKAKPTLLSAEPNSPADLQYTDDISTDSESTQNKEPEDIEELLEKARLILTKLNSQEITLKESLALYEKGMQSLKSAQEVLEQAKLRYQEFKD